MTNRILCMALGIYAVILAGACQAIVGEYGDLRGDDSENEAVDTDSDGDASTDTASDTDFGVFEDRSGCLQNGGFWFDANDVTAESEAEFNALRPSCHDTSYEACPSEGEVLTARQLDGTPVFESVETTDYYATASLIDTVYSTLRCLRNLRELDLSYNSIEQLDLSNNPYLEALSVLENGTLTRLDLPATDTVRALYLYNNRLTSLDISYAKNLETLMLGGGNKVTALDLSDKPQLTEVALGDNRIDHAVDLSGSPMLEYLELWGNPIGEIVLPRTERLTHLDLENTEISSVDVSECINLTRLDVSQNNLSSLDVGALERLEMLYAHENELTELDLSRNNALAYLEAWDNPFLSDLTMPEDKSGIEELHLGETALSSLDISGARALRVIYLENNNFTTSSPALDFSDKAALEVIHCTGNMIDEPLDLTGSPGLQDVDLSRNRIPSIAFAPETAALAALNLQNNQLTSLSLGRCPSLLALLLDNNKLSYDNTDAAHRLDLTGCTALERVWLSGNRDYVLSFLDGTFTDDFLSSPASAIEIESDKWEANQDPRKPDWAYDENAGMYTP